MDEVKEQDFAEVEARHLLTIVRGTLLVTTDFERAVQIVADKLRADLAQRPAVDRQRLAEIRERWSKPLPRQLFSGHVKMDIDFLLSQLEEQK